ncbi:hypothetical protein [Caballeronia pedi]|uniref:hypothetical protein n=1 Tax=Caballeronia pedi TaxID=1777141 RepID=UPI00077221E0|nr:hypothetical protein [Caballeronia pedi]
MADFTRTLGVFYLILLALFVVLVVALCSLPRGWRAAVKHSAAAMVLIVIAGAGWNYRHKAMLRSLIDETRCTAEHSPDNRYVAHLCLSGRHYTIRLNDLVTKQLVAERTVIDFGELPVTLWENQKFLYQDGDSEAFGAISLPPSYIDRLLAKLP